MRDDSPSLLDGEDLIRRHVGDRLRPTRRPHHFNPIGARGSAEAKVGAQIVLTQVAGPRLYVTDLGPRSRYEPNPRANRLRVAPCGAQAERPRPDGL